MFFSMLSPDSNNNDNNNNTSKSNNNRNTKAETIIIVIIIIMKGSPEESSYKPKDSWMCSGSFYKVCMRGIFVCFWSDLPMFL